jgi:glucose/arabinose dehydrogenase
MTPRRPNPLSPLRLLSACAAIALLGAVVALASPAGAQTGTGEGGVALRHIGDFESPSYVAPAPGFGKLLFVVELPGTIRVVRNGKVLPRPFLDISDQVSFQGEEGLLSVAFDPRYEKTRRFYVYYVDTAGDLRIDEFKRRRGKTTVASAGSQRRVLGIPHPIWGNHNGGQLQFGPDGKLWLATGDGGGGGDGEDNARDLNALLGKLLRIDPSVRKGAYGIPKDNPFVGRDGADEIWAYGLRNPWRFSFDSATGDLAIADVGQGEVEEVNYLTRPAARGANFGWPQFEGNQPFDPTRPGVDPPTAPVFTYSSATGSGNCSVTGGYVVHDPALSTLRGRYVYADLCAGQLRSFVPSVAGASDDKPLGLAVPSPTSFGEDSRGRIYVTSIEGAVHQLVPG